MERKTIMIDMDDVIVSGGFLYLINKFLGTNYKAEDFTEFYMQDIIPNKDKFFEFFFKENMYDHCILNDSVVEVIEKLSKEYDVYIGTSYLFKEDVKGSGIILLQKHNFLVKHFPFINPYNFIFLANKSLLSCDIKIDDNPKNLENAKTKILYDAYHNRKLDEEYMKENNIIRAHGWKEIEKMLLNNSNK